MMTTWRAEQSVAEQWEGGLGGAQWTDLKCHARAMAYVA